MSNTKPSQGPWMIGEPGGPSGPFYSVINSQGRVVAAMVANRADAELMVAAQDMADKVFRVLDDLEAAAEESVSRHRQEDAKRAAEMDEKGKRDLPYNALRAAAIGRHDAVMLARGLILSALGLDTFATTNEARHD